ncbi:Ribonuclease H-like domain, partial [Cinara cedri]
GSEEEQKPQCVIRFEVLSNEALQPSKLKRHLETKHKEHVTKTIDFFKNKEYELRKNMKCIKKSSTSYSNENAVKASFAVSLLIGKSGKPHTIAEDLILPAAKAMVSIMISKEVANNLNLISLSNDTIKKRIDSLSGNIKEQLLRRINECDYFSLQLDESTDITNKSILLCYVRYNYENTIFEDILFVTSLIRTTAEEIFTKINEFIILNEIEWTKCVGVSTDVTWHHCRIHREAIVSKKIPTKLKEVLDEAVKIVKFIKAKSLNSRLFEQLCKDMDSEHYQLLLHFEIRWVSRGKVLSRLFELRHEVRLFFIEHKSSFTLSERLNDFSWLASLAYLSDIFAHLNIINLSLQGSHVTIFKVEDKIEAMIK